MSYYISVLSSQFNKRPVAICIGFCMSASSISMASAQTYTSPVMATGGSQLTLEDNSIVHLNSGSGGPAGVYAADAGSSITAGNISVSTVDDNVRGAEAYLGAKQTLFNGGSITTTGNNAFGAFANRGELNISGNSSKPFAINTAGASSHGIYAAAASILSLNDVSVTTSGAASQGIFATEGSTINTQGSRISTTGTGATGAHAVGANSTISNDNVSIMTMGDSAVGVKADDGGLINVTGNSKIATQGVGAAAVGAEAFGGPTATVNLLAGEGNTIQINTFGNNSSGILAQLADSRVHLDGVQIATSGDWAAGVYLNQADSEFNRVSIQTSGSGAEGITAIQSKGTIANTRVETSAANNKGINFMAGSVGTITDSSVTTSGENAIAVTAQGGSTLTLTRNTITTEGVGGYGLKSSDTGSVLNAADTTVITTGNESDIEAAAGAVAEFGGTMNLTGTTTISTSGSSGLGLLAQVGGSGYPDTVLNAGDGNGLLSVTTTGDNAFGGEACSLHGGSLQCTDILSDNHDGTTEGSTALLNLKKANITTRGANSYGLYALGADSQISGDNVTVTTAGQSAHAVAIRDGDSVVVTNSHLQAQGNSADGVYMTGNGSSITATNTVIDSSQQHGVYSADGNSAITLIGGTLQGKTSAITVAPASGTPGKDRMSGVAQFSLQARAVSVAAPADTVTLSASEGSVVEGDIVAGRQFAGAFDNSVLNGNVTALSPETLSDNATLSFTNNSVMTGSVQGVSRAAFSDAVWNMTDSSTVTGTASGNGGLALQNGTVNFVPNGTTYKTLTVSSLNGSGTFIVNTELNEGGVNTHSDLIHVTGNTVGDYNVKVNNTIGTGAKTVDDGIKIAQLDGDSTGTAVKLSNHVTAGAYEYLLYQGGSQDKDDWFLRSDLTNQEPGTDPGTTPTTPSYNPAVPGYVVGPYLNRMYGFDTIGTLHERVGDQENLRKNHAFDQGVWGRIGGGETKSEAGRFNYDADTWFAQFGSDLYQAYSDSGTRTHAGVTVTLGQVSSGLKDPMRSNYQGRQAKTGSVNTKGYGLGVYYTRYAEDSSYIDTVAQYTHYRNDYSSIYGENANQQGNGMTLSVEVGKPFKANNGLFIEPQAQILYQYLHLDSIDDGVAKVSSTSDSSGLARMGVRLGYDSNVTSNIHPYLTADALSIVGRSPDVSVSNTSFHHNYSSQWGELGAGVTGDVTKNTSVYATLKYKNGFDGNMHGVSGNLGIRVNW
ncbi:TPA: autotransporter outer membrane beta-barrel domain-containing protein [Citrobacter braakii]